MEAWCDSGDTQIAIYNLSNQSHALNLTGDMMLKEYFRNKLHYFLHLKQFWSTYQHHDGTEEMI